MNANEVNLHVQDVVSSQTSEVMRIGKAGQANKKDRGGGELRQATKKNRGKAGKAKKDRMDEEPLRPALWKELSEELIEKVVLKLPFASKVRLRTVSKRWNDLIISSGLEARRSVPIQSYHGAFATKQLSVYHPISRTWENHSMSFVRGTQGSYTLVAGDGGLLCFTDVTLYNFVVCNPLTKRWNKHLSPLPLVQFQLPATSWKQWYGVTLVGMYVDMETGSYNLVVVGLCSTNPSGQTGSHTTLVFDSVRDAWREGSPLPSGLVHWPCQNHGRSVSCNGALYWLCGGSGFMLLAKYDLEEDSWSISDPIMCAHPGGNLVVLNGKVSVMMVDLTRRKMLEFKFSETEDSVKKMRFELFEKEMSRLLSDALPRSEIFERMHAFQIPDQRYAFQRYSFVGQEGLLFVPSMVGHRKEVMGWKLLIFDRSKDECTWLPIVQGKAPKYSLEDGATSWWYMRPDEEEGRSWLAFVPYLRPFL